MIIAVGRKQDYDCSAYVCPQTPFMQLMFIKAKTKRGWDALQCLKYACWSGNERNGTCVKEKLLKLKLGLECARRSQPPMVVVDAVNLTNFYPQFAAAPGNDRICVLTLRAESGLIRTDLETAYGWLEKFSDVMLSSYDNGELTVAFAIANKL